MSTSDPAALGPEEADEQRTPAAPPRGPDELDVELPPGTVVGEYHIESKLGQGGMASVYAGVQPVIGKKVAIKVMSRELCVDPVQVERFVQEARAVNQIGHPNIVDVFAFGNLPDGRSYFVMEWLQGETLAARLRRGWLSIPEALAIIFQICDGLAAAHDKGIVHRDLKPENIFLVPVRQRRLLVKLLDFGIAKLLGRRDERVDRTAQGMTPGTPSYMSPEQTRGKDVDHRTDIYSLGVTAFQMVCGRLPFLGTDAVDILYQHVHASPPAPSSVRGDLPLQLERLILQMLEKKPDRRPTIPVIEERLAELRDGPLASLADSAPMGLRALEQESGRHKAIAATTGPTHEPTEFVSLPNNRPPRALTALAAGLLAVAVAATAWKLTRTTAAPTAVTTPVATQAPPAAAPQPTVATPPVEEPRPAAAEPAAKPVAAEPPKPVAAKATRKPAHVAVKPVHRKPARHDEHAAAPAAAPAASPNRDYMIDPFAPKK